MKRVFIFTSVLLLIFGCDSVSNDPSLEGGVSRILFEVNALGNAQTASIEVDGQVFNEALLPWKLDEEVLTTNRYQLSVRSEEGPIEVKVSVNSAIREVKRGEIVVVMGNVDADKVEVSGLIDAIDASGIITVKGLTFAVTDATRIQGSAGEELAFSALQEGDFVEVEGRRNAAGDLIANEIELQSGDDDDEHELEVEGQIEELAVASLTVQGFVFVVSDSTRIEGHEDSSISFSALQIGDYVEVEGYRDINEVLVAKKIEIEDDEQDADDDESDGDDDDDGDDGDDGDEEDDDDDDGDDEN